MPNLAEILTAGGILRAGEVVEIAQAVKLDVAAAAVLLAKESGGGANVWGHDAVPTAGAYTPGGPVTRDNYRAYRDAVLSGKAGRNGVGPTQLTYGPLQSLADSRGGCWDWRVNCAVGFEHLAQLIRQYGVRDGYRRYNGSGSAADRYADDAMARLRKWQDRLAVAPVAPAKPIQEDDMALTDQDVERIADAVWRRALVNSFGDTVEARQILNGTEKRTAEILETVARRV